MRKDNEGLGSKQNGRGFTKEKRFVVVALKDKDKQLYPSPSQYNSHVYNTISESTQYGKFHTRSSSFGPHDPSRDKYHNRQYYKELERGYTAGASPGPGAYEGHDKVKSLSHVRKSTDNSFTKVSFSKLYL